MAQATLLLYAMATNSFAVTFRTSAAIALLSYFTRLRKPDLKFRLHNSMY